MDVEKTVSTIPSEKRSLEKRFPKDPCWRNARKIYRGKLNNSINFYRLPWPHTPKDDQRSTYDLTKNQTMGNTQQGTGTRFPGTLFSVTFFSWTFFQDLYSSTRVMLCYFKILSRLFNSSKKSIFYPSKCCAPLRMLSTLAPSQKWHLLRILSTF